MKKVSIIMLAYNKLEYTKLAVDSLYKYTSHIDFEFISVNNGSSDGTKEYLDSLPNKKKISFETNVGGDRAFNEGINHAEGEYTVFLNNDLILTENWLDNLIVVLESDPNIGVAVPACNSSSNFQTIPLEYYNTIQLQEAAKKYNKSNSRLWEERLRLMLYAAIFRTKELKDIEGLDEIYSPGGFDDDDLTCRYRRSGYKLIFAKDTYIHHYGSVTIGDSYASILGRNREIFKNKFGYDSWEANDIDFEILNSLEYSNKGEVNILGVGKSCAATLLQMKNRFREVGVDKIALEYVTLESKYIKDLNTVCDRVYEGTMEEINSILERKKYNYIYLENAINSLEEYVYALKNLCNYLSDIDGNLILSMNLIDDLGFNGSYQNELLKDINEYGYNCTKRNLLENRIIYVLSKEVLDK
jgi:GT2 family glycosyltransferase